jgi:hypothetical protein
MKFLETILFVNPGHSRDGYLTAKGKKQIVSIIESLIKTIGANDAFIITSPTAKAKETASLLASALRVPSDEIPELREYGGMNYLSKAKIILNHLRNSTAKVLILVAHEDDRYVLPKEILEKSSDGRAIVIPYGYGILSKAGSLVTYGRYGCSITEPMEEIPA